MSSERELQTSSVTNSDQVYEEHAWFLICQLHRVLVFPSLAFPWYCLERTAFGASQLSVLAGSWVKVTPARGTFCAHSNRLWCLDMVRIWTSPGPVLS